FFKRLNGPASLAECGQGCQGVSKRVGNVGLASCQGVSKELAMLDGKVAKGSQIKLAMLDGKVAKGSQIKLAMLESADQSLRLLTRMAAQGRFSIPPACIRS